MTDDEIDKTVIELGQHFAHCAAELNEIKITKTSSSMAYINWHLINAHLLAITTMLGEIAKRIKEK